MEKSVYNNYLQLKKLLKKNRFTHNLSSQHFNKLYKRFTIPTITITGLVSIGGFLNSSNILPDNYKTGVNIGIGVLGIVSTSIQSMLHATEYSSKKKMFENAANGYDELLTQLEVNYNGITSKDEYINFKNKMDEIEKEILKITNNCKYLPPLFVIEKWTKQKYLYFDLENDVENVIYEEQNEEQVTESETRPLLRSEVRNEIV